MKAAKQGQVKFKGFCYEIKVIKQKGSSRSN